MIFEVNELEEYIAALECSKKIMYRLKLKKWPGLILLLPHCWFWLGGLPSVHYAENLFYCIAGIFYYLIFSLCSSKWGIIYLSWLLICSALILLFFSIYFTFFFFFFLFAFCFLKGVCGGWMKCRSSASVFFGILPKLMMFEMQKIDRIKFSLFL